MSVSSEHTVCHISSNSLNKSGCGDDIALTVAKNYAKDLLKSRIFLGRYVERRLVDKNIGYRDIIVLSVAEIELKNDLLAVQHKLCLLRRFYWIGITDSNMLNYSPASLCLWSEIDNQPFGVFWFQIRTVQFLDNEVIIKVKVLRMITEAFLELEPILISSTKQKNITSNNSADGESFSQTMMEIKSNLSCAFTFTNIKDFVTFIMVLLIAIVTGSVAFVNFLGNFVLALIRESSLFLKNSTPMFLGILDFFSKCVGGFYILLAMIFKPNQPNPMTSRRIKYYDTPVSSDSNRNSNFDHRNID